MSFSPNPLMKLAPGPTSKPKYSIQLKNGECLADPRANRAMVILMNQQAVNGGAAAHWGGPSAFAEIMSSVHYYMFQKSPWYESFNFVNDAGHTENGVYALRANYGFDNLNLDSLKGFRSIDSKLTGHGEAHLNPEGVFISNGPLGSGLPQAQGLAMADKMSGNSRITVCTVSDGASMEGEAKEAFSAIPGLYSKGKINPFLLIISDNNTKLSGRIDEDSFSMNPTFSSLESLGWDCSLVEKGNDLETCFHSIGQALQKLNQSPSKPIALVFKTVKGFGLSSTEKSSSGGHGYPLKGYDPKVLELIQELYQDKEIPSEFIEWAKSLSQKPSSSSEKKENSALFSYDKIEKIQVGLAQAAIKAKKDGYPVVSLSADLQGSTGIAPFHKEFPESSIDLGVAESNMVSCAAGMSKQGYIPLVDTFAQFGITKGNLPLIMANLSEAPVICLFSHTGFQDAADGASHQATTYMAAVASIPNVNVIQCSCSSEVESLLYQTIQTFYEDREKGKTPNSTVFFLGRETFPNRYTEAPRYQLSEPQLLKEGGKVATIVATGSTVKTALEVASKVEASKSVSIINLSCVNFSNLELLKSELNKTNSQLITIEDHQVLGGMSALVSHQLLEEGVSLKLKSFGMRGHFGQSAYEANELYKKHGFDSETIASWITENL